MKFITYSEAATEDLARGLARQWRGGQTLALIGDLGAGKTAFSRGTAIGLGIKEMVNSPTFVIMKVYRVKNASVKYLAHLDAYRLNHPEELLDIGVADYWQNSDCLTVVEWADKVASIWPPDTIAIKFSVLADGGHLIEWQP